MKQEDFAHFDLDYSRTCDFVSDHLSGTNQLCDLILGNIDFQKGSFFTILPSGTKEESIYQFGIGGIANGVRDFTRDYVYNALMMNRNLSFVIDSYNETFKEAYDSPLFLSYGHSCENEVYYILNGDNSSKDAVISCFQASDTIWHSLSVLTNAQTNLTPNRILKKEVLNEVVNHTELIIMLAYDQEGYIFWRRDAPHIHGKYLNNEKNKQR